jgi:hypothetical protein
LVAVTAMTARDRITALKLSPRLGGGGYRQAWAAQGPIAVVSL